MRTAVKPTSRFSARISVSSKTRGTCSPFYLPIVMTKNDIMNTFHKYAIFSSLLKEMEDDSVWANEYINNLVNKNFKSETDLILYVRNN